MPNTRKYVIHFMDQGVTFGTVSTPNKMTFREVTIWAIKILNITIGERYVFGDTITFEITKA